MAALLIGHGAVLYFGLSRALGIAFVAGVLLVAAAVHLKRFGLRTALRRRRSRGDQRHGETAASDEP